MTPEILEHEPFPDTATGVFSRTGRFATPLQHGTSVLLVGVDASLHNWAGKWFAHEGLALRIVATIEDAISACLASAPSVVVVDSLALDQQGAPIFQNLACERAFARLPLMVICQSPQDTQIALDIGATDVVRKPIDWNIISRRAATLARYANASSDLAQARDDLKNTQDRAEDSRRFLSQIDDTDRLTGLPSQAKFREIFARALCQTDELALFLIGLERFHLINDAHGREIGNRVLEAVGARLHECLIRPELHAAGGTGVLAACTAKLDGVRFGLFLPHSGSPEHLQTIRSVLTDVLNAPLDIDGHVLYITSSIGGAFAPRDGNDASSLLHNAEHAMMTVKRRGGGFGVYSQNNGMSSARVLELDSWLRDAVAQNQLKVAYQPLVNLWNDRIVGAEALLRWKRDDVGYISPAEFIPVAERSETIVAIGDFVIDTACAQLRRWLDAGHVNLRMAINLSVAQLRRGDVKRSVENAIDRYNLDPGSLELEISERGAIGNDQRIVRLLHEIKSIGVRLSLDDFGTGDAAIEYLKRLPIDVLKLDRSYVAGALENGVDAVIASALVGLARNMNLTVIAEGVESREQHELLRSWGCHLYQGFFCSPAVFGDAFMQLLTAQSADHDQDPGP